MGRRVVQIKLRAAQEKADDNLAMAIKHPKFEDKFMQQALNAEALVNKLKRLL